MTLVMVDPCPTLEPHGPEGGGVVVVVPVVVVVVVVVVDVVDVVAVVPVVPVVPVVELVVVPLVVTTSCAGCAPSRLESESTVRLEVSRPMLIVPLPWTRGVTLTCVHVPPVTEPEDPTVAPRAGAFAYVIPVSDQRLLVGCAA
jgi:hypothetical protein